MGLDDRIALTDCKAGELKVCSFTGGKDLKILATSEEGSDSLRGLIIVFGSKDPNPAHLIGALGTTMGMYVPTAKADERGVIFREIMDSLQSEEKPDVRFHNVKYGLSAPAGMGIWISMSRDD